MVLPGCQIREVRDDGGNVEMVMGHESDLGYVPGSVGVVEMQRGGLNSLTTLATRDCCLRRRFRRCRR
jgi:hypothetical protein